MSVNGKSLILTKKEKDDLQKKIDSFEGNTSQFCKANRILPPFLVYPLTTGRCSEKTYKKILAFKGKQKN